MVENFEPDKKLGWFALFHPSDPHERSQLVSRFFHPYLLSGLPHTARFNASSPFANVDRVCQLPARDGIRFAVDENGHVAGYSGISLNPFVQVYRRQS
jgi:hypothetical protein